MPKADSPSAQTRRNTSLQHRKPILQRRKLVHPQINPQGILLQRRPHIKHAIHKHRQSRKLRPTTRHSMVARNTHNPNPKNHKNLHRTRTLPTPHLLGHTTPPPNSRLQKQQMPPRLEHQTNQKTQNRMASLHLPKNNQPNTEINQLTPKKHETHTNPENNTKAQHNPQHNTAQHSASPSNQIHSAALQRDGAARI